MFVIKSKNHTIFTALLFFLQLIFLSPLLSQHTELNFANYTNTLKPFLSEIISPTVRIDHGFINKLDGNYFVEDYNHRPFLEANLGTHIPIVEYIDFSKDVKFVSSAYFGMNVLVDFYGPPTSAVINTDYFMGFKTGLLKYTHKHRIRNFGINFIPVYHESTHLGDEFSLHGYQTIPDFKRINVSYESWELAFVINDPDTINTNLYSLKAGLEGLWNVKAGYYWVDSLEVKGADIPTSQNNFEFFLHLNKQRTKGFLSSKNWKNIFSMEIRNRTRFTYDYAIEEVRRWNYNMYFGWQYNKPKTFMKPGLFFRYYSGIMPYGQMRNTDGFHFIGLSLVYY